MFKYKAFMTGNKFGNTYTLLITIIRVLYMYLNRFFIIQYFYYIIKHLLYIYFIIFIYYKELFLYYNKLFNCLI